MDGKSKGWMEIYREGGTEAEVGVGGGGGGMEGQGARRVREMELCRFGRWTGEGKVDSERPPMNGSKGV